MEVSHFQWCVAQGGAFQSSKARRIGYSDPTSRARCYNPLVDFPALYLTFAFSHEGGLLETHSTLRFARRYGLLRVSYVAGQGELAESLDDWEAEIARMRRVLLVGLAAKSKDQRLLGRALSQDLTRAETLLRIQEYLLHPGKADRHELSTTLAHEADSFIDSELLSMLGGISLEIVRDNPAGEPKLVLALSTLIEGLWYQLLRSLGKEIPLIMCETCKGWMPARAEGTPTEARFCSTSCRVADYMRRRRLAGEFNRAGRTISDIAEALRSDPDTVAGWLKQSPAKPIPGHRATSPPSDDEQSSDPTQAVPAHLGPKSAKPFSSHLQDLETERDDANEIDDRKR